MLHIWTSSNILFAQSVFLIHKYYVLRNLSPEFHSQKSVAQKSAKMALQTRISQISNELYPVKRQ